ncbi:MAG: hypothetical protein ABF820_11655 [Sporolactobacillus sp.]
MKPNVWLLRPLPNGDNHLSDFLSKNIIAVGYPIDEDFTGKSNSEIETILDGNDCLDGYTNVVYLVNEMRIGDYVVIPDDNKKDVYFAKITSDYVYDSDLDVEDGYPHQRSVRWFFNKKPYPRNDLPEALKGSLRYPGAVANLAKHFDIVSRIINGGSIDYQDEVALKQKALDIAVELLDHDDPKIRLKAAEIIINN